jgi:hypothetical protein
VEPWRSLCADGVGHSNFRARTADSLRENFRLVPLPSGVSEEGAMPSFSEKPRAKAQAVEAREDDSTPWKDETRQIVFVFDENGRERARTGENGFGNVARSR